MPGGVNNFRATCAVSVLAMVVGTAASPVKAQVAPTEVNEPAVDEFGLERKTGRFHWQSHEIIAVGGGDSDLNVVVNDVRNPAWAETKLSADFTSENTNVPHLFSYPVGDYNNPLPEAINPNLQKVTISYFGGSQTFECSYSACTPEYFLDTSPATLLKTQSQYIFIDKNGIKITFDGAKTKIEFPDGRETVLEGQKYRKNNFGYMLKISGPSIQAVNLSIDYCDSNTTGSCSNLTQLRSANIVSSQSSGTTSITDANGGITTLRWIPKTAKRTRPHQGSNNSSNILNLTEKYIVGVTYPGHSAESLTLNYNNIDPNVDTHDDIRVISITKYGITSNYEYTQYYPYGREIEPPVEQQLATIRAGFLYSIEHSWLNSDCLGGDYLACMRLETQQALMDSVNMMIEQRSNMQPLPQNITGDPDASPGGSYYLTIQQTISGQTGIKSYTLKPESKFGSSRRRLLYVSDALNRKTELIFNPLEEAVGSISPEGNIVYNEHDARFNIVKTIVRPKPGSGLPDQETLYEYEPECTPATQARCNKPLKITDPKGNITEYSYNDRGQVLTETKPAPTVGAPRPKVTNTYTMRTAYIKDQNGAVVAAGPPISLLTQSSSCISTTACAGTLDEVVTTYDYGPTTGLNNLRLRGVAVTAKNNAGQLETLRTCYQYNYFGERISETKPSANVAVCP